MYLEHSADLSFLALTLCFCNLFLLYYACDLFYFLFDRALRVLDAVRAPVHRLDHRVESLESHTFVEGEMYQLGSGTRSPDPPVSSTASPVPGVVLPLPSTSGTRSYLLWELRHVHRRNTIFLLQGRRPTVTRSFVWNLSSHVDLNLGEGRESTSRTRQSLDVLTYLVRTTT